MDPHNKRNSCFVPLYDAFGFLAKSTLITSLSTVCCPAGDLSRHDMRIGSRILKRQHPHHCEAVLPYSSEETRCQRPFRHGLQGGPTVPSRAVAFGGLARRIWVEYDPMLGKFAAKDGDVYLAKGPFVSDNLPGGTAGRLAHGEAGGRHP